MFITRHIDDHTVEFSYQIAKATEDEILTGYRKITTTYNGFVQKERKVEDIWLSRMVLREET